MFPMPSKEGLVDALSRVMGRVLAHHKVDAVCIELGYGIERALTVEEQIALCESLGRASSLTNVVAMSWRLRCETFLARQERAAPAPVTPEVQQLHDQLAKPERMKELSRLDLDSPKAKKVFDALAKKAANACQMPISLVSVVMDTTQYFMGAHGLGGWLTKTRSTPSEWAFCANVVNTGKELIVKDARTTPGFMTNPLVVSDGVVCYAGVPLTMSSGVVLGTLCVASDRDEKIDTAKLETLRKLCTEAVVEIERLASPA